jgi:hypothetical protein
MLFEASSFNIGLAEWDVSKVSSMLEIMFTGATIFNQDFSSWDTSSVENICKLLKAYICLSYRT